MFYLMNKCFYLTFSSTVESILINYLKYLIFYLLQETNTPKRTKNHDQLLLY
jgi:hypothetical protein